MFTVLFTALSRYLLLYISEGCQPANQLYYVDLNLLARNAQGAIDWAAYDLRPPEGEMGVRGGVGPCMTWVPRAPEAGKGVTGPSTISASKG